MRCICNTSLTLKERLHVLRAYKKLFADNFFMVSFDYSSGYERVNLRAINIYDTMSDPFVCV